MLARHETTGPDRRHQFLFAFVRGALLVTALLSPFSLAKIGAGQSGNQVRIIVASTTLTAEPCASPDAVIDPGETVTVSFALQNTGTTNTSSQLVATLLPTGGVTAPSDPQNYGALVAGGYS